MTKAFLGNNFGPPPSLSAHPRSVVPIKVMDHPI